MKETVINWDSENKEVFISTSETYIQNRLDKLCIEFPNHYCLENVSGSFKNYYISEKKLIKFLKPIILSESQKEKCRKRMRNNFNFL